MNQRTATVEVAGKKVVIGELTFNESIAIDGKVPVDEEGNPSQIALAKIYALASVHSVDGVPLRPTAGEAEWQRAASIFSAIDAFALSKAYNDAFKPLAGEALKNESSDPA